MSEFLGAGVDFKIFIEGGEDLSKSDINEITAAAKEAFDKIRRDGVLAKKKRIAASNRIQILRVAADYLEWLHVNNRKTSITTFVDEFCFDHSCVNLIYPIVVDILDAFLPYTSSKILNPGLDALDVSSIAYPKPPYFKDESQ